MVHPSQVSMYRPGPGQDVALYDRAQENNPDPSCMVPVLATGFEDLKRRIESQEGQTGAHKGKLSDIQEDLQALERQHHLVTSVKLQEYKRRLTAVVHKVLRVSFVWC